ncbi:MAG: hypothetical protein CMF73_00150 [Maricaulis sp.]|nr:hypothetical protein [Maricaulis sp.]
MEGLPMLPLSRAITLATLTASLALVASCSNASQTDDAALWTANPDRLGPIAADTPFRQDALAEALVGFTVNPGQASAEGETYLIYEARRTDAAPVELVIDGDGEQLLAVTVRVAELVQSALDVGMLAGAADLDPDLCFPGVEERSGDVVCQDERPTGLTYWIRVDHAGPDGELPPLETLNAGTVYEIQWVPVPG